MTDPHVEQNDPEIQPGAPKGTKRAHGNGAAPAPEHEKPAEDAFTRAAKQRREPKAGLVQIGKRIPSIIPVRSPAIGWYVRVSRDPDMSQDLELFCLKEIDDHHYYVEDDLIEEIRALNEKALVWRRLHLAITKTGTLFLWKNGMENADGGLNSWHASAQEMIELAKDEWITVYSNKQAGGYEYQPAKGNPAEPEWPEMSWEEILRLAFRRYHIKRDHTMFRHLTGEI